MVRRITLGFGGALLLAGLGLLGDTVYLELKAALAEVLIERAFAAHLETGRPQRPWEWADTDPIARLDLPRLAVRQHVLRGASGGSMAFGLGHVDGTAPPNAPGNCVLVGHRDTWFSFLREVRIGDELVLRTASGRVRYRVDSTEVIEADDRSVLEPSAENRLTLVTCYPLSGLAASDHRYVVRCTPTMAVELESGVITAWEHMPKKHTRSGRQVNLSAQKGQHAGREEDHEMGA